MSDELLELASEVAFERLADAGGDPRDLQDPLRTIAIVYAAQGVIDNGGLRYLFEADWPGQPPYSLLSDAYRNIGAAREAQAIDAATALFDFADPQTDSDRRCELLAGPVGERIEALDGEFSDDIWRLLSTYAHAHARVFEDLRA
ncbi:DMP19 family protein [Engelhardtia mirabilis]